MIGRAKTFHFKPREITQTPSYLHTHFAMLYLLKLICVYLISFENEKIQKKKRNHCFPQHMPKKKIKGMFIMRVDFISLKEYFPGLVWFWNAPVLGEAGMAES